MTAISSLSPTRRVLLFAVVVLLTCSVFRSLAPVPGPLTYAAKLDAFAAEKDRYDIVFLGTSRTHHTLIPSLMDQEFKKGGYEFRTYNFGLFGAEPFEIDHLIDDILRLEPARLKWFVIEWIPWSSEPRHDENRFSDRWVQWHTPGRTRAAVNSAWLTDVPLTEKLRLTAHHIEAMAMKYAAFGQLGPIIERSLADDRNPRERAIAESQVNLRGFRALQVDPFVGTCVPPYWSAEEFQDARDSLDERNAKSVDLTSFNAKAQRGQIERIEAAGAEVLYVTMPAPASDPMAHRLAERGDLPNFLPLNSPERSPTMYRIENYFDRYHVNNKGAQLASRIVGRSIAAWMRERNAGGPR